MAVFFDLPIFFNTTHSFHQKIPIHIYTLLDQCWAVEPGWAELSLTFEERNVWWKGFVLILKLFAGRKLRKEEDEMG